MIKKTLAAGAAAAALGIGALAPAGAATTIDAFWGTTTTGGATPESNNCGNYGDTRFIDENGFCVVEDSTDAPVELGVKFTTSEPVAIGGIRAYRVDPGQVTGTLWTVDGENLATGTFAGSDTHSWQDLTFDTPVVIYPGETYVASYYSPNTTYAFEWNYFTEKAVVSGPLTALQSVEGNRNGLFCYGTSCGVPHLSSNDTNYWVSPRTQDDCTVDLTILIQVTKGDSATFLGRNAEKDQAALIVKAEEALEKYGLDKIADSVQKLQDYSLKLDQLIDQGKVQDTGDIQSALDAALKCVAPVDQVL
jgi:hypothetical protein